MKKLVDCILILFIFLSVRCSETPSDITPQAIRIADLYIDSVFLNIDGDLYEHDVIWGNVDTYLPAFMRMKAHLKIVDGRLAWDFKNGAELKISENIYEYVTNVWIDQNKKLDSGDYCLEFLDDDYRIVSLKQGDFIPTKTGQYIIVGNHYHNINVLHQVYLYAAPSHLRSYIENLDDYSVFRPSYGYGASNSCGKWSYFCENGCYHLMNTQGIGCDHNIIGYPKSDIRGGDEYEWVLNRHHLPLISLINRNCFKR